LVLDVVDVVVAADVSGAVTVVVSPPHPASNKPIV